MLERLGLWWQRYKTRRKMDRVFSRGEDPYGYRRHSYETARLKAMEESLGGRRYASALEVGCAEGIFTERLVDHADRVTAVDISPVALGRARARLSNRPVEFHQADVRDWSPGGAPAFAGGAESPRDHAAASFDLIILGDVLYYLDKPLVRPAFEAVFRSVRGWLAPGGRLILAHGFAGPEQRAHRRGFRERFEGLGLRLVSESVVEGADGVSCLLSVLENV